MKQPDRIFRQHDVAPHGVVVPLYRQLTQEWAQLHALASTRIQVRRWGRSEPALAGFTRPGDIVDAVDAGDHDCKNTLLLALIRLFQSGQQLAGRTVLQALLPRLSRIKDSRTSSFSTAEDAQDEHRHAVLAEFWDVMADYPIERRPTRVAANLSLDTLHRVSGTRPRALEIPTELEHFTSAKARDTGRTGRADHVFPGQTFDSSFETKVLDTVDDDLNSDADLHQVISWGIRRQVITVDEGQLLTISYIPQPGAAVAQRQGGFGFAVAAAELGCSQAAVRQRCSRAARRLAAAVHHHP